MRMRQLLLFLLVHTALTHSLSKSEGYNVGITTDMDPNSVSVGHIVSERDDNYALSTVPYSVEAVAVVTNKPDISLFEKGTEKRVYLAIAGDVSVVVSATNGMIKKGDYITTSDIPGVGMKATRSGYVIGIALEDFDPEQKNETGLLNVSLEFKDAIITGGIFENPFSIIKNTRGSASSNAGLGPLKYILVVLLIIISFSFSLCAYCKSNKNIVLALQKKEGTNLHDYIKTTFLSNFKLTVVLLSVCIIVSILVLAL